MHNIFYFLLLLFLAKADCLMKSKCQKLVGELADTQRRFIGCITEHAVPVKMCMNCSIQFQNNTRRFAELKNDTECKDTIFDKDRINMIATAENALSNLWEKANCDNCLINNNFEKFNDLIVNLTACNSTTPPQERCIKCLLNYLEVNSFYTDLEKQYDGDVCFDIQDTMNRTRVNWSKDNGCCKRDFNIITFLITASIIGFMPVIFYVGIYFYTIRRETNHDVISEQVEALDSTIADLMNNVVRNGFSQGSTNQLNTTPSGSVARTNNLIKRNNFNNHNRVTNNETDSDDENLLSKPTNNGTK